MTKRGDGWFIATFHLPHRTSQACGDGSSLKKGNVRLLMTDNDNDRLFVIR
jgi:hypothetical protein